MKGSLLFLPSDKPENHAVGMHYGRYGELVAGFCVTGDGTIIQDASNLNNEDDKGVGDDDDKEKEDDDWGKRDDKGVENFDGRVKEKDGREKSDNEENDKDHSGSGHLRTLDKLSSSDTPSKPFSISLSRYSGEAFGYNGGYSNNFE